MKNIIMHKKGEASFVTYIKKRIKLNLNFICLFKGATGIGKTYNGISLAFQLDPSFDAEKQITFDFQETMSLANDEWFRKKKQKIILWDEPQISISNRSWQSEMNRLVNYFLSTFRHQNVILILAAPYQDFLDSQTVKLIHCIFECEGWNARSKLSRVRPRLEQYNSDLKKMYHHSLHVIRNGAISKMKFWDIRIPPKHLIDVYEIKKTQFTSKLNEEIQAKLNKISQKNEPLKVDEWESSMSGSKPPTPLGTQILSCWKQGIFIQHEIATEIKSSQDSVSGAEQTLRKQGYLKEVARGLWDKSLPVIETEKNGGKSTPE